MVEDLLCLGVPVSVGLTDVELSLGISIRTALSVLTGAADTAVDDGSSCCQTGALQTREVSSMFSFIAAFIYLFLFCSLWFEMGYLSC